MLAVLGGFAKKKTRKAYKTVKHEKKQIVKSRCYSAFLKFLLSIRSTKSVPRMKTKFNFDFHKFAVELSAVEAHDIHTKLIFVTNNK